MGKCQQTVDWGSFDQAQDDAQASFDPVDYFGCDAGPYYGNSAFQDDNLGPGVCETPASEVCEEPDPGPQVCQDPNPPQQAPAPPKTGLDSYDVVPDDFVGPLGPNQIRQSQKDQLTKDRFGDFNVVSDDFVGPLAPGQMRQSDYTAMQSAWLNLRNGQGMSMTGSDADKEKMFQMMRDSMSDSPTARKLMTDIGNDTDPTHQLKADLGRHQNITGSTDGVIVDTFGTNQIDLSDIEAFSKTASKSRPNEMTQSDVLLHILAERRSAALDPTAIFDTHHENAFKVQNAYRAERGQSAILEQTFIPGTSNVRVPFADGSEQVVKFDGNNNTSGFDYKAPPKKKK